MCALLENRKLVREFYPPQETKTVHSDTIPKSLLTYYLSEETKGSQCRPEVFLPKSATPDTISHTPEYEWWSLT